MLLTILLPLLLLLFNQPRFHLEVDKMPRVIFYDILFRRTACECERWEAFRKEDNCCVNV